MVKILHVIPNMARGGAETFLSVLLPLLSARGFHTELACLFDGLEVAGKLRDAGIDITVLGHDRADPFSPLNILRGRRLLGGLIRSSKPDIVNSHLFMADMLTAVSAPRGSRIISTLHGSVPWWFWRSSKRWSAKAMMMTSAEHILGRLRGVRYIAVSDSVRSDFVRNVGMPGRSVRLIYNCIDPYRYSPSAGRAAGGRPTIIQVGNFSPVKNHIVSVKAMEAVLKAVPDARLRLVGDGKLRPDIEAEVERRGIREAVEFMGSRDDVPELLREADVFWMPSTTEGFSMACLEAMSSGLPCIVSDIKGLAEAVTDEVNGYLVPVGDYKALAGKTALLLRDRSLAHNIGMAGRSRVMEEFSPARAADEYIKAYNDIIEGSW